MHKQDEFLIERIRPMLHRRKGLTEKKMFGGVCFLINGNMCVGTWRGALVVRLDRTKHEDTQAEPHVRPMDITGKVMRGWALVDPEGIATDECLRGWLDRAVRFARTLPVK